jgi:hypothetical protein
MYGNALVWVDECLVLYHVVYSTNIDIDIIVGKSFIIISFECHIWYPQKESRKDLQWTQKLAMRKVQP